MTEVKNLSPITLKEFEEMEKDERLRYEFIDGIILMSPSPSREHQRIGTKIIASLVYLLSKTSCEALYEYDIKFKDDVYKPDVMVFCDKNAELPEIIFEILSPSTRRYDLKVKLNKYEEMGVKEYWIIDPKTKSVTVHDFVNSTAETYTTDETIRSCNRPEIVIKVADIFA